jgi:hypothetical protein
VRIGNGYVRSVDELFAASLGPEQRIKAQAVLHPMRNRVRTRFIPGGQQQFVFSLPKTADNAPIWDLLAKAKDHWDVEFCYCSVFQECWDVHSELREPEHVKQCRRGDRASSSRSMFR